VGIWRTTGVCGCCGLFEQYEVKATFFACAMALEQNPPSVVRLLLEATMFAGTVALVEQCSLDRGEPKRRAFHRAVAFDRENDTRRPLGWFTNPGLASTRGDFSEEGFVCMMRRITTICPTIQSERKTPGLVGPLCFRQQ